MSSNWRIVAATLFSAVLIGGSYFIARGFEHPQVAQASTETELLKAIATRDSDGDGLSDWEEALYGTDPHASDSFQLGMTDGEAVTRGLIVPKAIADVPVATSSSVNEDGLPPAPAEGTLTAAFAKSFFTLFMAAKEKVGGRDLTESEMSDVSTATLQSLGALATAAPDYKTAKDITAAGSGREALQAFAASAEAVLAKNASRAPKSELLYLKDAVENNDTTAIPNITKRADAYRDTAVGLSQLPVPQELAADDLALINAMMRISEISRDFARVSEDPLATILALQQYPQAVLALTNSFIHIGTIYKAANISLTSGEPGAAFVNLIADLEKKQAKKP